MIRIRKGFTLIEVLVVLAIISILVSLMLPNILNVLYRGRVIKIVTDIRAIRNAALNYYADKGSFPPDTLWGVVPAGFSPYLPPGLIWDLPGWRVRYSFDNYGSNAGWQKTYKMVVGVSVNSTDKRLITILKTNFNILFTSKSGFYGYQRVVCVID